MDGPINPEVGFDDGMRWVELFDLILWDCSSSFVTSDVGTLDPINVVEAPRASLMGSIRFRISHSLNQLENANDGWFRCSQAHFTVRVALMKPNLPSFL